MRADGSVAEVLPRPFVTADEIAEAVCAEHPEKLLKLGEAPPYRMVASAPVDRQMKARIG